MDIESSLTIGAPEGRVKITLVGKNEVRFQIGLDTSFTLTRGAWNEVVNWMATQNVFVEGGPNIYELSARVKLLEEKTSKHWQEKRHEGLKLMRDASLSEGMLGMGDVRFTGGGRPSGASETMPAPNEGDQDVVE